MNLPTTQSQAVHADIAAFLSQCNWLAEVPQQALQNLAGKVQWRTFKTGEYIYRSREAPLGVYGVRSGSVKISYGSPDGQDAVTTVIAAGTWFGELFLWAQQSYFLDCRAMQDTRLLLIPSADFQAICAEYPVAYRNQLRDVSTKALSAHWMAVQYKLSNPEMLVARRLDVAVRMQALEQPGEWVELKERLSHELIAQMLGLSRPRVSLAIKNLVQQGLMTAQRGRINIHVEKMRAYCR